MAASGSALEGKRAIANNPVTVKSLWEYQVETHLMPE